MTRSSQINKAAEKIMNTFAFQVSTEILTCAGVSVSLIGCPTNRNLICLIDKPWTKHLNAIRMQRNS